MWRLERDAQSLNDNGVLRDSVVGFRGRMDLPLSFAIPIGGTPSAFRRLRVTIRR